MEDKKYYLTDIESGFSYEVSKETYDAFHKMLSQCLPVVIKKGEERLGKVILFGTAGDFDGSDTGLKDLWYDPSEERKMIDFMKEKERNYIPAFLKFLHK